MPLYVAGAGGFARETLDAVLACGDTAAAFLADDGAGSVVRGLPVLAIEAAPAGAEFVVAISDPPARRRVVDRLVGAGLRPVSVVDPRAVIGPGSRVGAGSVVLGHAFVSSDVTLGAHVHVNYGATVGHDAVLEDCVTVLPGANIAGTTVLGAGVTIGANAAVLQGLRVGAGSTVGAGAVVTRDVPPGVVVVGVPARVERGVGG